MEKAYTYNDLNEVPDAWRTFKGAKLTLFQINAIIKDAYTNALVKGEVSIPDYGGAKKRFEEANVILDSFWVSKKQ